MFSISTQDLDKANLNTLATNSSNRNTPETKSFLGLVHSNTKMSRGLGFRV